MTGLKSCPYCGSDHWLKRVTSQETMAFQCKGCGSHTKWIGIHSDISVFNRRYDPYIPDWSKAPEWALWHAFDENGDGCFFEKIPYIDNEYPDEWLGDVMQHSDDAIEEGCPDFYMTLRCRPKDK